MLDGKVVVVTAAGASVVVNDLDADVAAETAQALVDRAVKEFGRLDVMCTNAAEGSGAPR
jgi:NAD(P)-dependent dehydrogenase (short-subunit alcohol dehydrogenase family)